MVGPRKTAAKASPESTPKEDSKEKGDSVKKSARLRSPARTKSPGRQSPGRQSPARQRSPSRRKSESVSEKSPSRKGSVELKKTPKKTTERSGRLTPTRRSPIRKSPSRSIKLVQEEKKVPESAIPVLRKKQKIIDTDTESDTADEKIEVKEKPKAAVRGRTRTDLIEKEQSDFKKEQSVESNASNLLKRVTRSQNREVERIVHLKHFETVTKKLAEFSDEDDLIKESSQATSQSAGNKKKIDYAGPLFIMFFLPLSVFAMFTVCTNASCSFRKIPANLEKFAKFSTYFESRTFLGYLAYFVFAALLSALPFGGRKVAGLPDKQGKFVYVMNGLFIATVLTLSIIGLEIKNVPITNFIVDRLLQLYVASLIVSLLLTALVYVRSFYVPVSALNPQVVGKSRIYGFYMGRELHPRPFGVFDLKSFFIRMTLVGALLLHIAILYNSLGSHIAFNSTDGAFDVKSVNIPPTLLLYFILYTIYVLDGLIFEHTWVTSKQIQQEGFGFNMGVCYLLYPFCSAFTIKYIVDFNVELAYWKLALITLANLTGYILYRGSNSQKDGFRKNPYSPAFSHLESIPTTQGKKLLSSGFWGIVRHPNYLGNILIELSFVPFVLCVPPVVFSYMTVLFLVYRAGSDNAHCKQKYGAAWDRYCNRVRYLLVPKVY